MRVSSAELLRSMVRGVSEPRQVISSHSCKVTLLSWCAKAGLDLEVREVLGRRCSSMRSTAVVYSRDLQAPALLQLREVIEEVRLGNFDPSALALEEGRADQDRGR